jgi:hypothetical protein
MLDIGPAEIHHAPRPRGGGVAAPLAQEVLRRNMLTCATAPSIPHSS